MIEVGRSFDGFDELGHLYIVLSHPTADGRVAVVNLRSHYPSFMTHGDHCLIVTTGEHQWVRRDSCVYYSRAVFVRSSLLEAGFDDGTVRRHPRCSPMLLQRILQGALVSPGVSDEMKAAIRPSLSQLEDSR